MFICGVRKVYWEMTRVVATLSEESLLISGSASIGRSDALKSPCTNALAANIYNK